MNVLTAALYRSRWVLAAAAAMAFLALFFVYPLGTMTVRSFTDFVSRGDSGFANYHWFFTSDVQLTILRRTFLTSVFVTVLCLAVGYPYAYLMTVVSTRWRMVLLAAVLMPFWTSLIVRTYSWIILLGDSGPIAKALRALGFGNVRLLGTTTAVTIGMAQIMLPFLVLPLYSQLTQIDRTLLRAAEIHGSTPRTALRTVYLPLSVPGITASSTIVFVLTLGFYFTPALLGSPQNSLLSQQIVSQVNSQLAFGRGGAMALALLLITLLILAGGSLLGRPFTRALGTKSEAH
ncbi:ABC transporter permease [Amycolatopsis circi]|uniref:ABC transporter permease n=1 Tax=Amycolatopsis circi TaxID=871959 RepID=UPI001ABF53EF|nr:ABC transporter permease [Amycolatopsis circi]